ncbi:MAG: formamidopyrimidine-DNA glycosylase [Deltaproteobacteria bacterium HGW-Deltaproteobacteria-6]|jgi:formamidopyrimidine-DNA glycosylase|nr:MAG: formamidopyrimidine-DNA glycosylase [Deltaproteobacteria bacterium HGW-Deltaproteobacteria-6]
MPELPEVETLCRQLNAKIAGEKILETIVYDDKLAGLENVKGQMIEKVQRIGKTIVIMLSDGRNIAIHLRMTGRLFWRQDIKLEKHTRWRMTVGAGSVDLLDPRRFATIKIGPKRQSNAMQDLMTDFDEKVFLSLHAPRKVSVKVLLMDPKAIAGIGNIYACEILHQAGISPFRQAETLSEREWKTVFRQARRILKRGIEKRGTSISDWRDLYGCKGENQNELKAYGQEGNACCACGGVIVRLKQNGRSTFYCPRCQE